MQLGLGLVVPTTGSRADVVVTAPAGTRLADVHDRLVELVLPAAHGGRLAAGGCPVPPHAVLGEPPLVEGAVLVVDGPVEPPPAPAPLELRCVSGQRRPATGPLPPGTHVLGRNGAADVRVDDPDVSRVHCRLAVPHPPGDVTVTDLGSTNGTTVDREQVTGATPVPAGAVLAAGESRFVVAPAPPAAAPVSPSGDGRLGWNRPPRLRPARDVVQVVVPAPPAERERNPLPVLMVVAPLVLGVVLWRVLGNVTFLLFTLLSPVLVIGNVVTERRAGRRRGRRERALWRAQRQAAEQVLAAAVEHDAHRRREAHPDPAETVLTATGPQPRLWERRRGDDDVLHLRLGLADLPADVEAEGDVPPGATTARDVPVVVDLSRAGVVGVAGPRAAARAVARWLVVQAVVRHSPRDLQVVVLARRAAAADWSWTRWLPHARPDAGQDCRALLGLDAAQAAARVAELAALVEQRRAAGGRCEHRRVLVLVDGARTLRTLPGLAAVLRDGPPVGVHAVAVDDDPHQLPEECGATAVVSGPVGTRLDVRISGSPEVPGVLADVVDLPTAELVARALAPLHDVSRERSGTEALPASVRWTDLSGVALDGTDGDVAAVLERWAAPGRTTEALLGAGPDGRFAVDLRRDGPHALVAGTTGSGKSELLQTLIASLALGNRPDELVLVLVDYKGGAAFGPCAALPHVSGLVTDLDGALVERALASLTAELTRRESVLAAAGVSDVEEHRRRVGTPGGPREVLPRLVIVVDEFASLAAELPEFVDGLVGIAMRGRSLGVHLVLATQRPEGVVSADIRANTNLRLCLAVTRDSESRDVVDSPLAATVARSTPGRGYARTGHAELTAFQTARVGGRRTPAMADGIPAVTLVPVEDVGSPLPRAVADDGDEVTDLALLVAACRGAAVRLRVTPPPSPWLPPLPDVLVLDDVPAAADPLAGRPGRVPPLPFGALDVPQEQRRAPLVLDLDRSGHLLVVGAPRSGRTTALRTLAGAVASTAAPDDVHLYALDHGGGGLAPLAALPHAGAVVGADSPERLERVLALLATEIGRRQRLLAAGGHADLPEQRAAAGPADRLPHLLLLVDRWEAFTAAFGDVDGGRLVDALLRLLREGPSVGLHVVMTADRSGLVGRVGALFEDRLLLRLADRGDYAGAGVPARTVPGDLPPGRGFSVTGAPLLAQVALLHEDPAGPAQVEALLGLAARAPRPGPGSRPRQVAALPTCVPLADLPVVGPTAAGGTAVTLGVGGDELEPVGVDLAEHLPGFLVAGPPRSGRSSALLGVAEQLTARGLDVVTVAPRPSPLRDLPGCHTSTDAAAALEAALRDAGGDLRRCALLVDDAELLVDGPVAAVLERAVRDARDAGAVVVVAGTTDDLVTGFRGFVVDVRRSRAGVLLSPQSPADGDLLGVRLSRSTGGDVVPGRGLLCVRGRAHAVQLAVPARMAVPCAG
ncbi:MAG TPA: FtsK/SpoIIIE domain-containing protein [Mycobacteriales bacterium]|nr:FtsK/SpoIIIE domain-containing protein [Mycobacteriales bacterium]